ncbi:hypothetical protein SUGI_0217320 [Cryptomeria japonica]|uniref:uncharacterized protein LOC131027326 n=1 Tax=Cryptomeria japonica TaxID=3369 RepID=UPI002408E823|nr:uncharacterized protein LOC131027326 [Cryptomeria japonica]GLJ13652.1 hypothetical protein SUGI_0217320 [Cryptomeria japonica]
MGERTNVRYTPLPTDDTQQQQNQRRRSFVSAGNRYGGREDDDNDSNYDIRFDYMPKQKIPWKSIALALFLLAFGSSLLIVSHLIFTGHMGGDNSQAFGFLTIGFLMFLPGFYETRIAYYSWRGCKGFTFAHIPDY